MTEVQSLAGRLPVAEGLVEIDGEGFYAIPDVDRMPPFLMSVVSDGDRWMFLSSTGGLTAGRCDAAGALFPYETDDRLHAAAGRVGPVTAIRVQIGNRDEPWHPFHPVKTPGVTRCLYKSVVGNSAIFDETHPELGLTFRYRWTSSDRFGFIRTASLMSYSDRLVRIELVDGLMNLLPVGVDPSVYQRMSNLANAYKRSEVIDPAARLAVFSLESPVIDRPEPVEVLRASVAWSIGLDGASVSVNPDALTSFDAGTAAPDGSLLTGRPGAYLLAGRVELEPDQKTAWHIVADVAQDQVDVAGLRRQLHSELDLDDEIRASIGAATLSLVKLMAPADALQRTRDRVATAHQVANVTYNVMRGGIPVDGYRIETADFAKFVFDRNRGVAERHKSWLEALPETIDRRQLLEEIANTDDVYLLRLGYEYLPFGFSRRHGDPSRPWNAFSIRVRDSAGHTITHYEGNWRDIFQNWEALCMSFPEYLPSIISVFVNASTADGFNPYRITRDGIDWEIPNPDDPWSNIGYWGDHQIVYLLRLLEANDRYFPGDVSRLLDERRFSYADVPYRIVPYDEIVRDPKSTIRYDDAAAARTAERTRHVGCEGKLLWGDDQKVYLVTLFEKLLVPALTKLSNFVPNGGIWLNTQRPEWNDANNALAGFGLSMVTVYQLRQYLKYLRTLIEESGIAQIAISQEVADWLARVARVFQYTEPIPSNAAADARRREFLDELGWAFSDYRSCIYRSGFSGVTQVAVGAVVELCDAALTHLDATIKEGRRTDGLYPSYNLIHLTADGLASVEPLHEMLEGQVAVLSCGVLSPEEQVQVIDALFTSAMYRADQQSFMLYPARQPRSFLEKNVVPAGDVHGNQLLERMVAAGDRSIITTDADGLFRFNPALINDAELEGTLDRLAEEDPWGGLVAAARPAILETYENVFRHRAYTGRSGSMYAFEGIGSVYWHMVAKLLVAVQEAVLDSVAAGAPPAVVDRLVEAYWRIRSGFGFNKTAEQYGAIPTDPYSHTPGHAGAQQPGMTGLVKEELLTRPLELGVRVEDGDIRFDGRFLRESELLNQPEEWCVYDLDLEPKMIELDEGSLGMTLCQVPVIVSGTGGEVGVEIVFADGEIRRRPGLRVGRGASAEVFARSGEIVMVRAFVPVGGD